MAKDNIDAHSTRLQMLGKQITTQKLFMTPAIASAVNPGARNFQEEQQNVNRTVGLRFNGGSNGASFGLPL